MSQRSNATDVDFPHRVKALRQGQGWSQTELAEACGITRKTINNWERGVSRNPRAADTIVVALIFRVDLLWLLRGYEEDADGLSTWNR